MKELIMLIRPEKLEDIKKILDEINCGGMTLSTVMGCGTQKGVSTEDTAVVNELKGFKTTINLLPKVKVEVVVSKIPVQAVIDAAKKTLYTGHIGDGKIFVYPVEKVVKIRTGEEDFAALQDVE